MDTSAREIAFDEYGICSFCRKVDSFKKTVWFPNNEQLRNKLIKKIKRDGVGKKYDCIIGLSGGVDSSFLAHLVVKEYNLRPLAIHVDAGWNSEIATRNIEYMVKKLNLEFYSEVLDWNSVKELQRAYLFSGISNLDVPQDHSFFSVLYKMVQKYRVKYFVTGGNMATESILPQSWGYDAMDSANVKDIYSKNGRGKKLSYPFYSSLRRYVIDRLIFKIESPRILDLYPYNRSEAITLLEQEYNWKNYGDKHHESVWTKWFQSHYLPVKFGFDKRKAHLSSMINSGELSRVEAIKMLNTPNYVAQDLKNDTEFILKKLDVTNEEYQDIMQSENKEFNDYKNSQYIRRYVDLIRKFIK